MTSESFIEATTWNDRDILFEEHYPCPACRRGQLESLFMVDAFSCGSCHHVFTVVGRKLRLEDNVNPYQWRWNGTHWRSARHLSRDWLFATWIISIAFIAVPTGLIWLAHHTFPPLPGQQGAGFPVFWTALVFTLHFSIAGFLLAEYFQLPLYITAKLFWQRWATRAFNP
jgi:hypothetical protein